LYNQKGAVGGAFRAIPYEIPPLEKLGLPRSVMEMASLAARPRARDRSDRQRQVDHPRRHHRQDQFQRPEHIITVEDPIEFVHNHKRAMINQREVFADTHGFAAALKHVLRQDPDIVLIGEMRDLETIEAALVVAETGHLVFSTLHTNCAVQTINRVIDVFPPHQQEQVRAQLSLVLQGVVSQQLLPRADGRGRCLAAEIMIPNAAIRKPHPRGEGAPDLLADAGRPDEVRHADHEPGARRLHQRRLVTTRRRSATRPSLEELKTMLGQQAGIVEARSARWRGTERGRSLQRQGGETHASLQMGRGRAERRDHARRDGGDDAASGHHPSPHPAHQSLAGEDQGEGQGFDREINLPVLRRAGEAARHRDLHPPVRDDDRRGLPLVQCLESCRSSPTARSLCKTIKEVKEEVEPARRSPPR
jgi:twitching motility protein PilT